MSVSAEAPLAPDSDGPGLPGSSGTAQAKKEALEKAGVRVGKTPSETAALVRDLMK